MQHIAADGERLEEIFYKYHGFADNRYRTFCEKNSDLLHKDRLDAGDSVALLDTTATQDTVDNERIVLWE